MIALQELYSLYKAHPIITTDTRTPAKGSIFFALKGDSFDGNNFVEQAFEAGAAYAVVSSEKAKINNHCILVRDVLETLQALAHHHRKNVDIPIIAITGTNGKTTTKELMHAVLSKKYKCVATKGNLNNHIGVPLTLLSIMPDTEIAIVEMGANHRYEIDALCKIALPTHGLITNIGKAHLDGFGDFATIVETKTELYRYLGKQSGLLFVNTGNQLLMNLSDTYNRKLYGNTVGAYVRGEIKEDAENATPYLHFIFEDEYRNKIPVSTQLVGDYNFENAMAAVCVGHYFKISADAIKNAIEKYTPSLNRSQWLKKGKNSLILDAYNANPTSMRIALENFSQLKASNKILILGGMRELGGNSEKEHIKIVELLKSEKFKTIFLIGEEFKFAADEPNTIWFATSNDAKEYFSEKPVSNATILLKGSRGIALEKIVDVL